MCMLMGCGRELRYQEKAHADNRRTCKSPMLNRLYYMRINTRLAGLYFKPMCIYLNRGSASVFNVQ